LSSNREKSDEHEPRGGRNPSLAPLRPTASHTNTRDVTAR
jgi:hypothetical protein